MAQFSAAMETIAAILSSIAVAVSLIITFYLNV